MKTWHACHLYPHHLLSYPGFVLYAVLLHNTDMLTLSGSTSRIKFHNKGSLEFLSSKVYHMALSKMSVESVQ